MKVLITGGAGFIGTHLTRRLLGSGAEVRILDNFSEQIHGGSRELPTDIAPHVDLMIGDIQDGAAVIRAIEGMDAIVHLAAETGTGQSMYEVVRYERVNMGGTGILLQAISDSKERTLQKLVVASSRSIYGEGCYRSSRGIVYPRPRTLEALRVGQFEPVDPMTGEICEVVATPEEAPFQPISVYGLTKQVQEQMCLLWGETLGFSSLALRYQNVYGPGQSLKNPYTGILAIFSNQARTNSPVHIFEDGKESRDFVYVEDVVEATVAAVQLPGKRCLALNVGSGVTTSVLEVAHEITKFFNSTSEVSITGAFRQGDIRHCFADLTRLSSTLRVTPKWNFRDGIHAFLQWAESQSVGTSNYLESLQEMKDRGLYHV